MDFVCNCHLPVINPRQIPSSPMCRSVRFGVVRGRGGLVGGSYLVGMNDIPISTQSDGLERLLTITDLSEYLWRNFPKFLRPRYKQGVKICFSMSPSPALKPCNC